MVNEINKSVNDNSALSERLAASNRQLQEMQEEHRQLLIEMETLRQRATELNHLNVITSARRQRQTTNQQATETQSNQSPVEAATNNQPVVCVSEEVHTVQTDPGPDAISAGNTAECDATEKSNVVGPLAEADEDPSTAAYLQEKLAEITRLKSQFKRVQNMIDTTNLIENHLAAKELNAGEANTKTENKQTNDTPEPTNVAAPIVSTAQNNPPETNPSLAAQTVHGENEELLNTMFNMFTDFTADLRGQAESLRAERDRIKTLKEDIMQRKQQK